MKRKSKGNIEEKTMSTNNEIKTIDDFNQLVGETPLMIVTSYRGDWCPFCRSYLSELNKHLIDFPEDSRLVGISVDDQSRAKALQAKLGLDFDLLTDKNLVLHQSLGIKTGKMPGKAEYLQPSVLIYRDGQQVFEWIQTPKLLNMGGATRRLSVADVVKEAAEIALTSVESAA